MENGNNVYIPSLLLFVRQERDCRKKRDFCVQPATTQGGMITLPAIRILCGGAASAGRSLRRRRGRFL